MSPLYGLAYELTAKCDRQPAERVKAICREIDPALRETALRFFFGPAWKRHRQLWKRIARGWDRARALVGTSSSAPAGRQAASLGDQVGPSLDRCTEELAEMFRST